LLIIQKTKTMRKLKAESKVLVFPGDPTDPKKPQQQLVLTGQTLGKGQYGLV